MIFINEFILIFNRFIFLLVPFMVVLGLFSHALNRFLDFYIPFSQNNVYVRKP